MKVALIQDAIEKLKETLRRQKLANDFAYKYRNLHHFINQWDIEAIDLSTMYRNAFTSSVSERLWGGNRNSAKSAMVSMIALQKEFIRVMFKDLFNESKDLNMRVNRFLFHCDQIRREINKSKEILTDHYHTSKMASLYLAFEYPNCYTILEPEEFCHFLELVECKNIPLEGEFERHVKLTRGIFKLMERDEELVELYKTHVLDDTGLDFNMLAVHDLYSNTIQ
ncbi:MAG: hypothetical protein HKN09_04150 [Saprospiraceae bacterium]|nr:hypothetical protein [Saprospiraceae bacterium]